MIWLVTYIEFAQVRRRGIGGFRGIGPGPGRYQHGGQLAGRVFDVAVAAGAVDLRAVVVNCVLRAVARPAPVAEVVPHHALQRRHHTTTAAANH
jgi:hypothetical protein